MVFDKLLSLCEGKPLGTALTSDSVDLGQEKPGLGALVPAFYCLVFTKDAAGEGSVTFKIQDSDDNSSFSDLVSVTLVAKNIAQNMAIPMPLTHKRHVRLVTTVSTADSKTVSGTIVEAVLHNEYELIRTQKVVGFDILPTVD